MARSILDAHGHGDDPVAGPLRRSLAHAKTLSPAGDPAAARRAFARGRRGRSLASSSLALAFPRPRWPRAGRANLFPGYRLQPTAAVARSH